MIKRHRLLLLICGFIFAAGLALHSGPRVSPVYANVTLVSFTATSTSGQPEVRIDWETKTQFGTLGFYILRGDSATGPWARVSDFIYSTGDDLTGAQYQWLDNTTALNHFYSYQLEEITPNQSEFYGPITVIAGVLATNTPTPTRTRTPTATPTRTPTPTATPTETEVVDPSATPRSRTAVTPRVATGATITPRPPSASGSSSPAVFTATPALATSTTDLQLLTPAVTAVPSLSTAPLAAATVPPPPTAANVAQAPAPTLAPTEAGPAVVAPVVVATEATPPAASANSSPGGALMLIIAAILFLSLAFVILRQARQ